MTTTADARWNTAVARVADAVALLRSACPSKYNLLFSDDRARCLALADDTVTLLATVDRAVRERRIAVDDGIRRMAIIARAIDAEARRLGRETSLARMLDELVVSPVAQTGRIIAAAVAAAVVVVIVATKR